jgi:hypothetical protein
LFRQPKFDPYRQVLSEDGSLLGFSVTSVAIALLSVCLWFSIMYYNSYVALYFVTPFGQDTSVPIAPVSMILEDGTSEIITNNEVSSIVAPIGSRKSNPEVYEVIHETLYQVKVRYISDFKSLSVLLSNYLIIMLMRL